MRTDEEAELRFTAELLVINDEEAALIVFEEEREREDEFTVRGTVGPEEEREGECEATEEETDDAAPEAREVASSAKLPNFASSVSLKTIHSLFFILRQNTRATANILDKMLFPHPKNASGSYGLRSGH